MSTHTTPLRQPPLSVALPASSARTVDAWAATAFRALFPAGAIPTRDVVNRALAAAVPAIGTQVEVHWGSGRAGLHWRGAVAARCGAGFTVHSGKYGPFVSYVDLWCRDAVLVEPHRAVARVDAMLRALHARMPGALFGAVGTRIRD